MSSVLPKLTTAQNTVRKAARARRYEARRYLGFKSSLHRVRYCGRDIIGGKGGATLIVSGSGTNRRAGFGQVKRCGSVWACPVCSQKVATARAAELARVVSLWHQPAAFGPQPKGGGMPSGRLVFLTLTMRHKRGQDLADLWENGISAGWGKVTSGRGWLRDQSKYGTMVTRTVKTGQHAGETRTESRIGFARVVETTHGKNGWHVHIHALLFVRGDITGKEALKLGDSIYGRWAPALAAAGFGTISPVHGVDVRLAGPKDGSKVAQYFTKTVYGSTVVDKAGALGWEAAGGTGKRAGFGNRTPFQILGDLVAAGQSDADDAAVAAAGSGDDLALWWAWEKASKGKRQLTWSPWLREAMKLDDELTDQEIADATLEGDAVLSFRQDQFDAIFPHAAEVLDAAESDEDLTSVMALLLRILGPAFVAQRVYSGPLATV